MSPSAFLTPGRPENGVGVHRVEGCLSLLGHIVANWEHSGPVQDLFCGRIRPLLVRLESWTHARYGTGSMGMKPVETFHVPCRDTPALVPIKQNQLYHCFVEDGTGIGGCELLGKNLGDASPGPFGLGEVGVYSWGVVVIERHQTPQVFKLLYHLQQQAITVK